MSWGPEPPSPCPGCKKMLEDHEWNQHRNECYMWHLKAKINAKSIKTKHKPKRE